MSCVTCSGKPSRSPVCAPFSSQPAPRQTGICKEAAPSRITALQLHPANTTARYAMLHILPQGMLTYRNSASGSIYLYADDLGCGCLYIGGQDAYDSLTSQTSGSRPKGAGQAPILTTGYKPTPEMIAENRQHPGWDWSVWASSADLRH
ncbi:hypothetical protein LOC54_09385 [Acetobacter sp. AN02]|uniref:hypothetical protein n=1 Tax=Acetobacter sp. AN02 TaxID=2894186 RepID=UPI00243464CE|nr:hypothetical protein [Acetobacter sp. AN02]MDG6095312.1 hypothetical protein [Acetobacter sp. AN02]